jgi:SAM-dependent methyltransferase
MHQSDSQLYRDHVAELERRLSTDEALSNAVGGEFVAIGKLEYHLLRSLGLTAGHLLIDVGCGSGRLATQLAPFQEIRYIGCDVVPRLIEYARDLCQRPDWQFEVTSGTTIPCADAAADFTCFFSVFTHLTHLDTFRYFREAHRALKPGGLLVMSFLEFSVACHWREFITAIEGIRADRHRNEFVSRDGIEAWARHAGFDIVGIHAGDAAYIPLPEEVCFQSGVRMNGLGSLGQSVAILRKSASAERSA